MTNRHMTWKTTHSTGDVPDGYEEIYQETVAADDLAQMVYDRRTELGLSQAQLAERAGMKQPAISRIEGGGTTPTVPLLRRLAAALDAELSVEFVPRGAASTAPAETEQRDTGGTMDLLAQLATPSTVGEGIGAGDATGQAAGQAVALVLVVAAAGITSRKGSTATLTSHVYDILAGSGQMPPAALHRLRGSVQAYMLEEQQLRPPADHRKTANLLTLALGNELGLTTHHDWHRELPQRVEKLLDECPAP